MHKLLNGLKYVAGKRKYCAGTKQYKILNNISQKKWENLLDELASSGTTLEYDNDSDCYVASNMTGM